MSQLSLNPQNLANALSQLTGTAKPASTNPLSQSLPVQLVFGGQQQITLQNQRSQQSVTVSKQALQGNVSQGKTYLAQVQQTPQATTLNLFAQNENPVPLQLRLTQQQFEQILRLPPSQVFAAEQKNIEVKGKILDVSAGQIKIAIEGSKQALTVTLPNTNKSTGIFEGQSVILSLQAKGAQWQVQIKPLSNPPVVSLLAPAQDLSHSQVISKLLSASGKPVALSQNLQPSLASWLGVKSTSTPGDNRLSIKTTGEIHVQLKGEKPTASIQLDDAALTHLVQEKKPGQGALSQTEAKQTSRGSSHGAAVQSGHQVRKTTMHVADTPSRGVSEVKTDIQTLQRITLPHTQPPGQTLQSVLNILSEASNFKNTDSKLALTNITRILSQEGEKAPPVTSKSTMRVDNQQVTDSPRFKSNAASVSLPKTVTASNMITESVPALSQSENIRQLLSFPPLAVTPAHLSASVTQPGIMGALITLLQLTLASRISRPSTAVSEQTQQLIASLFPSAAPKQPNRSGRPLSELNQLDQKHGLIKEIGKLLSTHQHHKLANAEAALQNQDTFYYVLPNLFSDHQRDIELFIRREKPDEKNETSQGKAGTCWHLTMKLDVGDTGQLLSKAKLLGQNLELDFYTSNDQTLLLVRNYLPLLKRRLDSLGIIVDKAQSQLGKIPESLQQRPYHIFETKA